jgi:hypothetical protein
VAARLRPPSPDADPREALRLTRRLEIVCGLLLIVSGATLVDEAFTRWAVIGCGLLSLSPWPGPAVILRRADKNPDILNWDPERRAEERAGRIAIVTTAIQALISGVVGYLIGGLGLAIFMAIVLGAIGALVSAWLGRRST